MSRALAIYQKELTYFFSSIVAYVVIMIFVWLGGYFFYSLVAFFHLASMQALQNPLAAPMSMSRGIFQPLFGNLSVVMLLTLPMLTMRLLSEERKSGTAELLFTYPISDWDAILGKYFAALTVFAAMLGLSPKCFVPFTSIVE